MGASGTKPDDFILSSGKRLVAVWGTDAFCELLRRSRPSAAIPSVGELYAARSYYALEPSSIRLSGGGTVGAVDRRDELIKVFPAIFRSELADAAVPKDHWPETDNFCEFQRFFNVEHNALVADFTVQKVLPPGNPPDPLPTLDRALQCCLDLAAEHPDLPELKQIQAQLQGVRDGLSAAIPRQSPPEVSIVQLAARRLMMLAPSAFQLFAIAEAIAIELKSTPHQK